MPPFIVKYYDRSEDDTTPIKKRNVLSVDDIVEFVEFVSKEYGNTWSILESARIEESLKRMDTNDWLKVAMQTNGRDNFVNIELRFIILTQMKDDPCQELVRHYSLFGSVGPHFPNVTRYRLWFYLLYCPWVGLTALTWISYAFCCSCITSLSPIKHLFKTYKVVTIGKTGVTDRSHV